jgi:hypothetical protein
MLYCTNASFVSRHIELALGFSIELALGFSMLLGSRLYNVTKNIPLNEKHAVAWSQKKNQ